MRQVIVTATEIKPLHKADICKYCLLCAVVFYA